MTFKKSELKAALLGGVIAEATFELYAWLLSPLIFGLELQPAKLVMALFEKHLNISLSYQIAFSIHTLIGIVGFSLFILALYKAFSTKPYVIGLVGGVGLWFFAQGVLAPAIGRKFMMEFGAYTQSSFIGHVGMALILVMVIDWVLKKDSYEQMV